MLQILIFLFYLVIIFFRDKKNINKSVNIISLTTSFFTTTLSLLYMITQNQMYSEIVYNFFIVGLFIDFIYTIIYHPKYVDPLVTMIHHPLYIFFTFYILSINEVIPYTFFFLQELPTFILNLKRYYNIKDSKIEYLFGFLFFLFRIVYHINICYCFKDFILGNKIVLFVCVISFFLHCHWFYGWLKKQNIIQTKKETKKETIKVKKSQKIKFKKKKQ